jgi:hypothetical protein
MATNPIRLWRNQTERYQYLGKPGKLVNVSQVITVPKELSPFAPYWVGLVELKGGRRVTAAIIGLNRPPQPGDRVVGVMRRLRPPDEKGIIEYGVKFQVQV